MGVLVYLCIIWPHAINQAATIKHQTSALLCTIYTAFIVINVIVFLFSFPLSVTLRNVALCKEMQSTCKAIKGRKIQLSPAPVIRHD